MNEQEDRRACGDCSAEWGDYHELYCTWERCPFCGGQLAACDCKFVILNLNDEERQAVEEYEDDSVEPLLGIMQRWEEALDKEGRVPYGSQVFLIHVFTSVGKFKSAKDLDEYVTPVQADVPSSFIRESRLQGYKASNLLAIYSDQAKSAHDLLAGAPYIDKWMEILPDHQADAAVCVVDPIRIDQQDCSRLFYKGAYLVILKPSSSLSNV